jgi:hypothetical protein
LRWGELPPHQHTQERKCDEDEDEEEEEGRRENRDEGMQLLYLFVAVASQSQIDGSRQSCKLKTREKAVFFKAL